MTQLTKPKYTSLRNFILNKSIDKRMLSLMVEKKLNGKINSMHIRSVINILFEELIINLIKNKIIGIGNFGRFIFRSLGARRHYNLNSKKIEVSNGKKIIRFELNERLHLKLINYLDIDKTFPPTDK